MFRSARHWRSRSGRDPGRPPLRPKMLYDRARTSREHASMSSGFVRVMVAVGLAISLCGGQAAWAGGSGLDDDDDAEAGTPFFGFVKNLTLGGTMPDAKVVAEIKGGNASLV